MYCVLPLLYRIVVCCGCVAKIKPVWCGKGEVSWRYSGLCGHAQFGVALRELLSVCCATH